MKANLKIQSTLLVMLLGLTALPASSAPFSFSYGGRFADGNGIGLTGTVSLEISFFRAATGGTSVVSPVQIDGVVLTDGVFQANVTALSPADVNSIFTTTDDVWVQIKDLTHNVTLPRQMSNAIPYALKVPVDGQSITYDAVGKLTLSPSASVSKIGDHDIASTDPNAGDVLSWDGSTSQWKPVAASASGVSSVNSMTGAVSLTTNNVNEGAANKYYTDARARAAVSASAPLTYNSGSGALAVAQASGSTSGFLSAADWMAFNAKQGAIGDTDALSEGSTNKYFTDSRARAALSASGPLSLNSGTGALSISLADAATAGYLSSTDWTVFNGKQDAMSQATSVSNGFLTSSDWLTFSSKQALVTTSTALTLAKVMTSAQDAANIGPFGAVAGQTGEVRFKELTANGANFVGLKSPDTLAANVIWTLPAADGSTGSILSTNGSGALTWIVPPSAPVTTVNGQTGAVSLDSDAVNEGSTNQYFTAARARSAISASGPLSFNSGTGGLSAAQANGSTAGYLSAADWTAFNAKQGALANTDALSEGSTNKYFTDSRARAALSASGPLSLNSGTGALAISQASGAIAGYLSVADWTAFNAKQNALGDTDGLSEGVANKYYTDARARSALSASGPLSFNSGTGALAIAQATGATSGYLAAADWATFDAKQNVMSQATSISNGYVTSSDWLSFTNKQAAITASTALTLAKITTAAQDAANVGPYGTAAGQTGEVRFKELTASGSNFVGLKSPDTLTANVVWTLPAADGGSGNILSTNGSGALTWVVPPSAPVTSVNGQSGVVSLNSDAVSEGSGNLYYTTARARSALSASGALGYNSGTGALSLAQANGSTAGYLSAADWTTFNAKQSALANSDGLAEGASNKYFTDVRARAALSASGPLAYSSGTGAFSIPQANGSMAGYLSAADWTTFNAKQGALANTDSLTEGSTNRYYTDARARSALSASGAIGYNAGTGALSLAQANGSTAGYLSAADWTTFNAKQGALANTDALTEGTTNKYYTDARARAALSATGAISYNNGTGALTLNALTNADLSAAAAIARTKVASGSANQVLINDGTGVLSSEAQLAATRGGTGISSTATFPATGVVVTQAAVETLTNKTISGSANTLTNLSASAITSGSLKASHFQDPRSTIVFFEDFFCLSTVANCNMNWTTSAVTSTITPVSSTSAVHPGIVRFAGGTGTTNYVSLIQGTTTIRNTLLSASSGVITLESAMVLPSTAGSTVRFGLCATLSAAGTCTNGVYFLLTSAVTNTSVKAEVMSSGTAFGPAADTTSFAAGAYHNYKIVITNDSTAEFYVNGTLLDTITTGAPYNAIFPTAAMNPAMKYSWVTAAVNVDVDYFGFRQQFATPR